MNLDLKWNLRQVLLSVLTLPLSLSGAIIGRIVIRMYHFYSQGLWMYPGFSVPTALNLRYALQVFWTFSISPVIFWLLLTLPLDCLIRRFFFRLAD